MKGPPWDRGEGLKADWESQEQPMKESGDRLPSIHYVAANQPSSSKHVT